MKLSASFVIVTLGLFAASGMVSAQTAAPTTDKPAATAPAKPEAKTKKAKAERKPKAERSAKSIECSTKADAKGLHGKERKKFRSQCKAGKA